MAESTTVNTGIEEQLDDPGARVKVASAVKRTIESEKVPDRIHTWPYLVRAEFLAGLIVLIALTAWSIWVDAPLEEPANPNRTPNPSKAPWYFLGLQEMLVYFDPWIAGVVLPSLIIVGLMVLPYIDVNTKGNGYYTYHERKFAILTYMFGYYVLWIALIVLGTFVRGPGWNLFMPGEFWDPHKVVALTNVDLPYALGARDYWVQCAVGAVLVGGYYALGAGYWFWRQHKSRTLQLLGPVRYGITAFLFLTMAALPVKMVLRIGFNIKYVWVTPWFNV